MDEEELMEFVREETVVGDDEIDPNYEFDAPHFHDFTRAETDSDAGEAERWFDFAGDYPPSPFIIKLKWRHRISVTNAIDKSKCVEEVNANIRGFHNQVTQEIAEAKAKCQVKSTVSRSSTLMKPTASHLAKRNQHQHQHQHQHKLIHSIRLKKKSGIIDDKSSQNSCITDELATKRQKLEAGYSTKEAQLKHKALLLHKVCVDGVPTNARPKSTIPREPELETAHRAERRRFKVNAQSGEQTRSVDYSFKSCGTSRKFVEAPSYPVTRRSKRTDSKFQMVKRCGSLQNKNTQGKSVFLRSNSINSSRQEKCERINHGFEAHSPTKKIFAVNDKFCISRNVKPAVTTPKTGPNLIDKRFRDEPPVDLFNKLCLSSELQQNTATPHRIEASRDRNRSSFQENKEDHRDQAGRILGTVGVAGQFLKQNLATLGASTYTDNLIISYHLLYTLAIVC